MADSNLKVEHRENRNGCDTSFVGHFGSRFAGTDRLCLYLQQITGFGYTNTRLYWKREFDKIKSVAG
jgi:hypothetical protein